MQSRFLKGPPSFNDEDELFEFFYSRRMMHQHYFVTFRKPQKVGREKYPPRVKLFRKFFVENAYLLEPQVQFLEITSPMLARRFGITNDGVLHHFTNDFGDLTDGEKIKFFTINLSKKVNTELSD